MEVASVGSAGSAAAPRREASSTPGTLSSARSFSSGAVPPLPTLVMGGHSYAVERMATLGPFLFSADNSGKVVQWDHERRAFVRKFHNHADSITSLVATADGFLFTSSRDGLICVWSVTTGHLVRKINRHFNVVSGIVIGLAPPVPSAIGLSARTKSLVIPTDAAVATQSTPSTQALVAPSAAAAGKKPPGVKPAAPLGPSLSMSQVASSAAPVTSSSSPKAAGKGKQRKHADTSDNTSAKTFPDVPLAFRKVQCGARENVSLDQAAGTSDAASSTAYPAGSILMVSFAMDESAILWDISAERADLGSTMQRF
jgi:WD40 repeat protein